MDKKESQSMIGVCPNCGKPFRIESEGGGEEWRYCADVCISPSAIPTGARLMPDQATLSFVDSNMYEYTRDEYIKVHGIDPLPIWKATEKWREEQMEKWDKDHVSRCAYRFITPPPISNPTGGGSSTIGHEPIYPTFYEGYNLNGRKTVIRRDYLVLGYGTAASIDMPSNYVITIYGSQDFKGKARTFYQTVFTFSEEFYGDSIKIRKMSPLEEKDKAANRYEDIISPEDIDEILNAHNKFRREVGVKPLTWDDQIATSAKTWANHLNNDVQGLEHETGIVYGENIHWGSDRSWTQTIESLASEKKCFQNGVFPDIYNHNNQCDDISTGCKQYQDWRCTSHYSQIVWAGTEKVGCGKSGDYWVLRYYPPGNVRGEKAY